jgi:predicted RNA-binding Zn-ribbon protein involved in translation (DUF1610 family)
MKCPECGEKMVLVRTVTVTNGSRSHIDVWHCQDCDISKEDHYKGRRD